MGTRRLIRVALLALFVVPLILVPLLILILGGK